MPAQLGQLKRGQDGKGLLQIHLWCPDNLPRLLDRITPQHGTNVIYLLPFHTEIEENVGDFLRGKEQIGMLDPSKVIGGGGPSPHPLTPSPRPPTPMNVIVFIVRAFPSPCKN